MPASVPQTATLDDLVLVSQSMDRRGWDVRRRNRVRRALSAIKGGRLARAALPATQATLLFSDVNDGLLGMGPFSPNRAGALPLRGLLDLHIAEQGAGAPRVELDDETRLRLESLGYGK